MQSYMLFTGVRKKKKGNKKEKKKKRKRCRGVRVKNIMALGEGMGGSSPSVTSQAPEGLPWILQSSAGCLPCRRDVVQLPLSWLPGS